MTEQRVALRLDEAAEVLGVAPRTLSSWTTAGLVPSLKIGNVRLYSVDALRRWALEESVREEHHAAEDPRALPVAERPVAGRSPGRQRKPRASGQALPVRLIGPRSAEGAR